MKNTKKMRRISSFDASQCETAAAEVCTCRCGGTLHGKSHKKLIGYEDSLLEKGEEITERKVVRFLNKTR